MPADGLCLELLDLFTSDQQATADTERLQTLSFDEFGNRLARHAADAGSLRLRNPFIGGSLRLVRRSTVRLIFAGGRPDWVTAYACSESGRAELLKDLPPVREDGKATEYLDVAEDLAGQSARIYLFRRASLR
jgi:hypothetical protein